MPGGGLVEYAYAYTYICTCMPGGGLIKREEAEAQGAGCGGGGRGLAADRRAVAEAVWPEPDLEAEGAAQPLQRGRGLDLAGGWVVGWGAGSRVGVVVG